MPDSDYHAKRIARQKKLNIIGYVAAAIILALVVGAFAGALYILRFLLVAAAA